MLNCHIKDPRTSNALKIENDGALNAYIIPRPPLNTDQLAVPFAEYMKLDGVGTSSFLINGSVTNRDFCIVAKEYDVYINSLVFTITDAGAILNQFGAIAALTNGLEFYYFNQIVGKYTIESGLKSNYDMIRLANFEPAFGTAANAMQLTNVIGTSEAYVGVIDLEDIFGLQYGLRLRANSTDKIGFIVKDNITGIDGMDVKAYGIRV